MVLMCIAVVLPDGETAYSVDELRAGGVNVYPTMISRGWPSTACLCGVDLESVLDEAGADYERQPGRLVVHRLPGVAYPAVTP